MEAGFRHSLQVSTSGFGAPKAEWARLCTWAGADSGLSVSQDPPGTVVPGFAMVRAEVHMLPDWGMYCKILHPSFGSFKFL